MPKAIQNAPQLTTGLSLYYLAFQALSTERTELGFIPWSAIQEYCRINELSTEQTQDMHYLFLRMDMQRNEFLAKKSKEK